MTGRYNADPRIDKFITWGLTAFCGLSLSIGAWFFKDLSANLDSLSSAVQELRTEVTVLSLSQEKIKVLEQKIDALPILSLRIQNLEKEVSHLREAVEKKHQ